MKNWMKIALGILLFSGTIVVFVFASKEEDKKKIALPEIAIHVEGENAFLTESELMTRLKDNRLIFDNQKNKQLDIKKIEQFIRSMQEVKNVNVFRQIGNKWFIKVELRKPIARIYNTSGQSFYLDEDGYLMERSTNHTARVLIFSGNINDRFSSESVLDFINNDSLKSIKKIDDVYRISNYVCNDPLLYKLIGQAWLEKDGDFVLVPLVGDQRIVFGTAYTDEEVAEKIGRLKTFYKEAMPYEGWNKYSEISVKYEGQIVCRKRSV